MSKLHPLGENVIAKPDEGQTKTSSGIFLTDNSAEKPKTITVVAVGDKTKYVKVGDRIVVKSYATTDIKIDKDEYVIVKEEDILAKVK